MEASDSSFSSDSLVHPDVSCTGVADAAVSLSDADVDGPVPTCGEIEPGHGLATGESSESCDARFVLTMQLDGNLVLSFQMRAIWTSGTSGYPGARVVMQEDGNLVVYDEGGVARWSSGTGGYPGALLRIQSDGNLVVACAVTPLWASNTCCYD
jgi:hypothetical protein